MTNVLQGQRRHFILLNNAEIAPGYIRAMGLSDLGTGYLSSAFFRTMRPGRCVRFLIRRRISGITLTSRTKNVISIFR
jgi:hypothetical protein